MNFRRILSKSSLKSSSSSGKSLAQSEEVSKLKSEIELFKQTIDTLKISVENRDAAIGSLAREKEKLYVELKSAQRTNRNLHQQMMDERDIHAKEKEFLINEIKRISKHSNFQVDVSQNKEHIEVPSKCSVNDELKAKDEIIYNIGAKYLKIKASKTLLRKKIEKLQVQNGKTYEEIIKFLSENRRNLDKLLNKLVTSSTVPPSSKKYLKLLKINGHLHYENTQLKLNLSHQKEYIENTLNNWSDNYCATSRIKLDEKYKSVSFNNLCYHKGQVKFLKKCRCLRNLKYISYFHGLPRAFSDSCIHLINKQ